MVEYEYKPLPLPLWKGIDTDVLRWHLSAEGMPHRPLYVFVWNRKTTDCTVVKWAPDGEVSTALTCPPSAITLEKST